MTNSGKKRVAVGMSGGVDSSVAAALLKEQGFEVAGVYMECWRSPGCRADEDRRDAMDVAIRLSIPFEVLDLKAAYKNRVVNYFYKEYEAGRTPNPDVVCNREIKFGMFYEEMIMKRGFDYIATGHYARVDNILSAQFETRNKLQSTNSKRKAAKYRLLRGVDEKKDQSYFLYQLREEQLAHILFPLGGMTKSEVRKEARKRGLVVADKPDSQGICFIGEVSVKKFLMELGMREKEGAVLLKVGSARQKTENTPMADGSLVKSGSNWLEVGYHSGAWFYTIGQRIGLSHKQNAREHVRNLRRAGYDPARLPGFYVVEKKVEENLLLVSVREELFKSAFVAREWHWIEGEGSREMSELMMSENLRVRIRHGGDLIGLKKIVPAGDKSWRMVLDEAVFGIAPGQACVLYMEDVILGGGVIA